MIKPGSSEDRSSAHRLEVLDCVFPCPVVAIIGNDHMSGLGSTRYPELVLHPAPPLSSDVRHLAETRLTIYELYVIL